MTGKISDMPERSIVTVRGVALRCPVCSCREFIDRQVTLNTSLAFFDLGWSNEEAMALFCVNCGHIDSFVGDVVELWEPEGGYPEGVDG